MNWNRINIPGFLTVASSLWKSIPIKKKNQNKIHLNILNKHSKVKKYVFKYKNNLMNMVEMNCLLFKWEKILSIHDCRLTVKTTTIAAKPTTTQTTMIMLKKRNTCFLIFDNFWINNKTHRSELIYLISLMIRKVSMVFHL